MPVQDMHLVSSRPGMNSGRFYPKGRPLARPNTLAYIFHKLRVHRNLTAGALAAKFGVPRDYVSQVESGELFPSLRFFLFCAAEFGANPEWVKSRWAAESCERYAERLAKRLGFIDTGGVK